MEKISKSVDNLNIIIQNMNNILSQSPHVVDDVYIDDGGVNIYLKKKIWGFFGGNTLYEFAIIDKDTPITNVLSFTNKGSDGYTVSVIDVNTHEVSYSISLFEGDYGHTEIMYIYDKLESLYTKEADDKAKSTIFGIFNIK